MPHPHAELVTRFYEAFQRRDAAAMAACYHPDVRFSDPVFPDLRGWRAGAMWQMLCEAGADLEVTFRDVAADDATGSAHWDAAYTFSVTGRKVLNRIDARFGFADGLIASHQDTFDLWRWTRMALGAPGLLLGWSPLVRGPLRKQAGKGLAKFIAEHGLSADQPIASSGT